MNQLCMFLAGIDYFIVECPTNGKKPYYNHQALRPNKYYNKSGKTFNGPRMKINNKTKDMRHNQRW